MINLLRLAARSHNHHSQNNENNFNDSNSLQINTLFELTGNKVADYHSQTAGQQNTQRCKSASGVMDGNSDDVKGLINFIRGTDYFDYDADCDLFEKLENPLADIYHSEMIAVGPPRLATPSSSKDSETEFAPRLKVRPRSSDKS